MSTSIARALSSLGELKARGSIAVDWRSRSPKALGDMSGIILPRVGPHTGQVQQFDYHVLAKLTMCSDIAWTCINLVSSTVAQGKLKVRINDGKTITYVPDHPLQILLNTPNNSMTQFDLLQSYTHHQLLFGTVGILLLRQEMVRSCPECLLLAKAACLHKLYLNAEGPVEQLMTVHPSLINNEDIFVDGVQMRLLVYSPGDGNKYPVHPNNILTDPFYNSEASWYGISPTYLLKRWLDLDESMTAQTKDLFDNNSIPSMIINVKPSTNYTYEQEPATVMEELKEKWIAQFSNKTGKQPKTPAFMYGDVTATPLTEKLDNNIAKSLYEEIQNRACCLPDTKIVTKRGLISIQDVVIGDEVVTHEGRWRRVTKTMINPVHDQVFEIKAKGFDALRVTGNHPVYGAKYAQTRTHQQLFDGCDWLAARDLKPKKSRGDFHALTLPKVGKDIKENSTLTLSEYIKGRRFKVTPVGGRLIHGHPATKDLPNTIPYSAALGRILGFYLAEGSGSGKLQFDFHKNETEYHRMVIDDLKSVFGVTASVRQTDTNVFRVQVQNAMLTELFSCGKARTKKLPDWAWHGTQEFYESVLWAWAEGDGYIKALNTRVTTASKDLAWQMRLIAVQCGNEAYITYCTQSTPSMIKGRIIKSNGPIYTLQWRNKLKRRGSYRIEDNQFCSPIQSIKPIDYTGLVYNLEVEEDHSYLTTGGMVHNCATYGVPPTLYEFGIRYAGKGAASTQPEQDFYNRTISKILIRIRNKINMVIVPSYKTPGLEVDWDLSEMGVASFLVQAQKQAVKADWELGLISRDTARVLLGYDPVGGELGDDFYRLTVMSDGSNTSQAQGMDNRLKTPASDGTAGHNTNK